MIHYEPGTDGIEAFIATATALTLAGIAATAGASVTSGYMAQHGARQAANSQTEAANHAADIQSKSAADVLKFQQDQAKLDAARQETNRHANYDQYSARERRIGSIGEALGLPSRQIPDYVPQDAPPGSIAGSQPSGQASAPPVSANGSDPISAALLKNYAALGVKPTGPGTGPTDIAYMAGKIQQTGGLTPDNVKYWLGPQGRIAAELSKANGGGSSMASNAPAGSIAATMPQTLTPAYIAPRVQPGSIRSFATA